MVRAPGYARALVAAIGVLLTCGGLGASPVAGAAEAPPPDDSPLRVRISTMSPATLPADGPITLTGTVTNRTDETWTTINLYPLMGDDLPAMRSAAQLKAAMDVPVDAYVGLRETELGRPAQIDVLEPGATRRWRIRVPVSAFAPVRPGAYWFGVHALGQSDSVPRDDFADGRARTFLPFVPDRFAADPLPVALVVPLTRPVRYSADGSLDDVEEWTEALGPDGDLTRVLDLADGTSAPLTWLVDPALLDAVGRLATDNPPRSLGPPGGPPSDTGGPEGTAEPAPEEEREPSPAAQTARAWLDDLGGSLAGDQVLTLPYGNIDVPATIAHDRGLYDLAVAQRSRVLEELGVDATPALAPPSGYLDAASIAAADADTRLLVTDRMLGARAPAAAAVDGRRLLLTSYGATRGSPGPGPGDGTVGLRQRVLAEAAVRAVRADRQPLVVVLPTGSDGSDDGPLPDPAGFFADLDAPWLELTTVDDVSGAAPAQAVSPAELDYPERQERRELDAPTVEAVADLIADGDVLQTLLVDNNDVAGVVTEEALTGLAYPVRDDQTAGRAASAAARKWVDDRLDSVRINASPGVTLSSAAGEFAVTLSNDLDQPVTVRVEAETDEGLVVETSTDVELAADSRANVLLRASSTDNRVHNVRLVVTDTAGVPIGATDQVPIRSVEVSGVIWLIMGTGAGLLFLAIAVRLVRRVRAARHGDPDGDERSENPEPVGAQ